MAEQQDNRPNVVVFFTDQQRWDTTGVHDNPLDLTPNFDRMAKNGTHVNNSFTCQPVCGPARSCLQTGLYATESGCYRNGIPLPSDTKTMGHHFAEAGYHTGYIGKWHLADEEPVPESQRGGYEYWLAANVLEFSSDAYNTVVYDNDNESVKLPGYRVDALTDAAIRYIDHHQNEPFFLFLSHLEPHQQNHRDEYVAPDGYREQYISRWTPPDLASLGGSSQQHLPGYYGMVKRLDEALGRLIDTLTSLNLLDNTIILFTSDHGCHFKTRTAAYKRSCHESSIRVPTAIQGPGFDGGGRVNELVSLIDLPPTLLDAAGIEVPSEMQGRSLLPLLKGDKQGWPEEVFVQISETQVGRCIRTQRWKYSVKAVDKDPVNDSFSEEYHEEFLYDLQNDPYELTNLVGFKSHQEVSQTLRERLIQRIIKAGEPEPVIIPAQVKPSGQRSVSLEDGHV
ncbi:sulfatase-like hydrolase/transferase [Lentibacillus sediminis]|uniref:sulfatase-like hydrolase/transferase n=1 Tax=Lentibacillus sediminis TaxID=1940529 RepID=UPI000C1C72EE|nr:sulfatase-like hydrolase/transferase [Lentibacillus sediminis]